MADIQVLTGTLGRSKRCRISLAQHCHSEMVRCSGSTGNKRGKKNYLKKRAFSADTGGVARGRRRPGDEETGDRCGSPVPWPSQLHPPPRAHSLLIRLDDCFFSSSAFFLVVPALLRRVLVARIPRQVTHTPSGFRSSNQARTMSKKNRMIAQKRLLRKSFDKRNGLSSHERRFNAH